MDNEKMGQFISELRKSKHMTQKDLAAKLNITDKAVSKWERGLSYPDISLLSSIAEILGVTTSELLNGENSNRASEEMEVSITGALQYADKMAKSRVKSLQNICSISFSVLLLVGIVVCAICDVAISGTFTWSLFPISSIVFAWFIFFPVIKFGEKGLCGTLITLSLLIIPFLYLLSHLVKTNSLILPIGVRMSILSIVFLWGVFALFKLLKVRKLFAGAVSLMIAIPIGILINFSLSKVISTPIIDIWDIFTLLIIAIVAIVLFILDFNIRKRKSLQNN